MIDMMKGFFEEKVIWRAYDWFLTNHAELTKEHLNVYLKSINKALEKAKLEPVEINKDKELMLIDVLIGLKTLETEKIKSEVVKQQNKYPLRFYWS